MLIKFLNKALRVRSCQAELAQRRYLNYPNCLKEQFPTLYNPVEKATQEVWQLLKDQDFTSLATHSPALRNFSWESYLHCSMARVVRVLSYLNRFTLHGSHVIDMGGYFGNTALALHYAGYKVTAADSYHGYGGVFTPLLERYDQLGVNIIDYGDVGYELNGIKPCFDAAISMGVIEHIPHTPKPLFDSVDKVLKPEGCLVLETPNLGYIYNRQKIAKGESIYTPISLQYDTGIPFEGHHREYTVQEVMWMLNHNHYDILDFELFNYSCYGLEYLQGNDLECFRQMCKDELLKEVMVFCVQKVRDAV